MKKFTTPSPSEIAEFVTIRDDESQSQNVLARRVLSAALREPNVQEKLLLLREVEAEWSQAVPQETVPEAAAHLAVLQESLRRVTQTVAGFSGDDAQNHTNIEAHAAVSEVARLRESGGGRWLTNAGQAVRDAMEAVRQNAASFQPLVLGRPHALRLPCFAPALAAPVAPLAPGTVRTETITTADGVRIEFQQLPGKTNRLRVLVDTSLLPPQNKGGKSGTSASASPATTSYNVAFLTLMEGAEDTPGANRHILVVALNERGVGFADFAVSAGGSGGEDKSVLPAPRTGGCNLVSATLSYLPSAG